MTVNTAYLIGETACGLTFLDWSLYYFSGAKKFYNPLSSRWESVIDNPLDLDKLTAHKHNKIHPRSLKLLKYCINEININANDYFHSIYVYARISDSGVDLQEFLTDNKYDDVNFWDQQGVKLLNETISSINDFLLEHDGKLLVLRINKDDILYSMFNNGRPHNLSSADKSMNFYNKFFSKNSEKWGDHAKIWDHRENLALCIRPFTYNRYNIDATLTNRYEITVGNMLDNLDKEIYRILDFFNITPIGDYEVWKSLYHHWQQLHDLKFYRSWQKIIDDIIQGADVDLTEYHMDFTKDTFIQHILIYKHNLNIKGYGLEDLPKNTKLINALLEPNIHHIDQIYS